MSSVTRVNINVYTLQYEFHLEFSLYQNKIIISVSFAHIN